MPTREYIIQSRCPDIGEDQQGFTEPFVISAILELEDFQQIDKVG